MPIVKGEVTNKMKVNFALWFIETFDYAEGYTIPKALTFRLHRAWSMINAIEHVKKGFFNGLMSEKATEKTVSGVSVWEGIRLKDKRVVEKARDAMKVKLIDTPFFVTEDLRLLNINDKLYPRDTETE